MRSLGLDPALTVHELRHTVLTSVVGRLDYPQVIRRRIANHVPRDTLEAVYVHAAWDQEAREAWSR